MTYCTECYSVEQGFRELDAAELRRVGYGEHEIVEVCSVCESEGTRKECDEDRGRDE